MIQQSPRSDRRPSRDRGAIWTPRNVLGILGALGGMVGLLLFVAALAVGILFGNAGATIALLVLGAVLLGAGLLLVVLGVALTGKPGRESRQGLRTELIDEDGH